MKSVLLTLLLLVTGIAAANAQSDDDIQSNIFDFLDESGYYPFYNVDDDIVVTIDDLTLCFVRFSSADDLLIVSIRYFLESDLPYDDLVRVANAFNVEHRLCKCSAEEAGFRIAVEFAPSSVGYALTQTERALYLMPDWIESLNGKL